MLRLTRISDGQEYTYRSRDDFVQEKHSISKDKNSDTNNFEDLMKEARILATFIKDNKVIEHLDRFIARYV